MLSFYLVNFEICVDDIYFQFPFYKRTQCMGLCNVNWLYTYIRTLPIVAFSQQNNNSLQSLAQTKQVCVTLIYLWAFKSKYFKRSFLVLSTHCRRANRKDADHLWENDDMKTVLKWYNLCNNNNIYVSSNDVKYTK